jgi:uncharacterized protein with PIN domain
MAQAGELKFIVDSNVGKLARWLRIMGYDSLFFRSIDDARMIDIALAQGRVILTKDTQIMRRRVITSKRLKAILVRDDHSAQQLYQVVTELNLDCQFRPFSLCLECNQPLMPKDREDVRGLVPLHVFQTQSHYMQCPTCHRVYWRGTHWQAMNHQLSELTTGASG